MNIANQVRMNEFISLRIYVNKYEKYFYYKL